MRERSLVYGLINRALEELVRSTSGDEGWQRVRSNAGVDIDFFEGMTIYDDDITNDLVLAASIELDTTADDILEKFGRYWIVYTGAEGWGPVLDSQGTSVVEVLRNLDSMHLRVKSSMPNAFVPSFRINHATESQIDVDYLSERGGFAPMVLGLLRGLAERFGEDWRVTQTGERSVQGHDCFTLALDTAADQAGP